jgi:hypothetical protein
MQYGGPQFISMTLRVVGFLLLVPGLLLALLTGADSFTQIVGGCFAIVLGLIFVALGALLQLLSDIASNTAPIAQLVEYAKVTNAFFVKVSAKVNQKDETQALR